MTMRLIALGGIVALAIAGCTSGDAADRPSAPSTTDLPSTPASVSTSHATSSASTSTTTAAASSSAVTPTVGPGQKILKAESGMFSLVVPEGTTPRMSQYNPDPGWAEEVLVDVPDPKVTLGVERLRTLTKVDAALQEKFCSVIGEEESATKLPVREIASMQAYGCVRKYATGNVTHDYLFSAGGYQYRVTVEDLDVNGANDRRAVDEILSTWHWEWRNW